MRARPGVPPGSTTLGQAARGTCPRIKLSARPCGCAGSSCVGQINGAPMAAFGEQVFMRYGTTGAGPEREAVSGDESGAASTSSNRVG